MTIRKIIAQAITNEDDLIVICEEDHEFASHYSKAGFLQAVIEAHMFGAGLLLGGIDHVNCATLIMENMLWIDMFRLAKFMVIYRPLFSKIIDEPFDETVNANLVLSKITTNKLVIYPSISRPAENATKGPFPSTTLYLEELKKIAELYPYKM